MSSKQAGSAKTPGMSRRQLLLGWRDRFKEDDAEDQARQEAEQRRRDENAALLQQARDARDAGKTQDAVALFRGYVKANPTEALPRRELGMLLFELGQYIQARVEFERLVRGPEPDRPSLVYLGLCLMHMDRPAKAVQAWQRFDAEDEQDRELAALLHSQCDLLEGGVAENRSVQDVVARAAALRYAA